MVILCTGDRGFYPSGQEGFLANKTPGFYVFIGELVEGLLGAVRSHEAGAVAENGVLCQRGYRRELPGWPCTSRPSATLGRKQDSRDAKEESRDADCAHGPRGRGQRQADCFQKGGGTWSPLLVIDGKVPLGDFLLHCQNLEIQTGCQQQEEPSWLSQPSCWGEPGWVLNTSLMPVMVTAVTVIAGSAC